VHDKWSKITDKRDNICVNKKFLYEIWKWPHDVIFYCTKLQRKLYSLLEARWTHIKKKPRNATYKVKRTTVLRYMSREQTFSSSTVHNCLVRSLTKTDQSDWLADSTGSVSVSQLIDRTKQLRTVEELKVCSQRRDTCGDICGFWLLRKNDASASFIYLCLNPTE
jgi:hypothetical protein